ncbi:MAG: gamma-glutamyl-gamma-aminobutyrate hydrolase family protein [Nitrospinae bacterium]|nr:gamma-glutamyl-gamma-aminobutyrate hydrolase family protein [Nitrospinota bacterium]
MRPTIGITADYAPTGHEEIGEPGKPFHFAKDDLVRAVASAGGVPFLVPCSADERVMKVYLEALDGLIFSGSGADIDPIHYGEDPHPALGRPNPDRLEFELKLARLALDGNLPLLGLCGGLQTLNVAAAGTLYQDISSQLPGAIQHRAESPPSNPAHPVSLDEGSRLQSIVGRSTLQVNSTHHQSVKEVGAAFAVCAVAPDGVVEAVEAPGERFVLGLQWHPEYLAAACPSSRAIFKAFVDAARAHAGR